MKPRMFYALVDAIIEKIYHNQELYRNDAMDSLMVNSIVKQYKTLDQISGTALAYQGHLIESIREELQDNLLLYGKLYDVEDLDDYIGPKE